MTVGVTVEGVSVSFGARAALAEVGFALEAGQRLAVVGRSGAGKTSLLRAIAGLLRPTAGTITLGELCLSPMGLSVVSKLAPQRSAGTYMGLWFVSTATGNYLSGAVGSLWDKVPHSTFFLILVGSSIFAAFVLRLVLRRLEHALNLVSA